MPKWDPIFDLHQITAPHEIIIIFDLGCFLDGLTYQMTKHSFIDRHTNKISHKHTNAKLLQPEVSSSERGRKEGKKEQRMWFLREWVRSHSISSSERTCLMTGNKKTHLGRHM